MEAAPVQVLLGDELLEARQVLGTQPGEVVDELIERRIGVAIGVGEPAELLERQFGAVLEDALRSIDPIGQPACDEVTDDVVRAPAVLGNVGRIGPRFGQPGQQCAQQLRGASQQVGRFADEFRSRG